MGWRTTVRQWERDERRRAKEADRAYREAAKADAQAAAAAAVRRFDALLEMLTSVHRERVERIDWAAAAPEAAPVDPPQPQAPPPVERHLSKASDQAVADYQAGFFAKLFGLKYPLRQLEKAAAEARAEEDSRDAANAAAHLRALAAWRTACTAAAAARVEWSASVELARGVLLGDVNAYAAVVKDLDSLAEIREVIPSQTMAMRFSSTRAAVDLRVSEDDVVPADEYRINAKGGVTKKKMAVTRRAEIYEDYVCGVAIRVARELLAALPIERVVVHVDANQLNTANGNREPTTVLSVLLTGDAVRGVNWDRADASDFVERHQHNMKRAGRGKGLKPVERLAED